MQRWGSQPRTGNWDVNESGNCPLGFSRIPKCIPGSPSVLFSALLDSAQVCPQGSSQKKKNRQPCPGGLLLVESKASVQRDNDWQGAVPVRPAPQKIAKLSQEQVRRLERPPETKTTLEHFWGVHIPLKVAAQKEQKLISESFSTGLQRKLAYVTSATCTQKALTLTQETSSTPSCSLQDGTNQH